MGLPMQRTKWDRPGAGGLPHTLFLELGAWGVFLARTLQESLPSGLWDNGASSRKGNFAVEDRSLFSPLAQG